MSSLIAVSETRTYDLQKAVTAAISANSDNAVPLDRLRDRNKVADFDLTKQQKQVLELLPKCGWAKRFVNVIAHMGSLCPWEATYRGEPLKDNFLKSVIAGIRPGGSSQLRMRKKALRLQVTLGSYALTKSAGVGRTLYTVWHPNVVEQSRQGQGNFQMKRSREDQKDVQHFDASQVRRFLNPGDEYEKEPHSDLFDVIDTMELYACAIEGIHSKAEQAKIFNNLLHLSLDNTTDSPYWSNPNATDKKTGKLLIEQSLEDLEAATRAAHQGKGRARFAPHAFLWPGDVKHIKLNDPLAVDDMKSLELVGKQGAVALPIPTPFLAGEEGLANHWGDAENHRQLRQQTIQPNLEMHDSFFTDFAFQPALRVALRDTVSPHQYQGMEIDEIVLTSDTGPIDNKPDNTELLHQLYMDGIVDRKLVAEAANVEAPFALPSDVSEYEHWLTLRTGDSPAEEEPAVEDVSRPDFPTVAAQTMALLS